MNNASSHPLRLVVLTPVFNDWLCAQHLLLGLGQSIVSLSKYRPCTLHVVMIDDGSNLPCPANLAAGLGDDGTVEVSVLRLHRNVGHQRAICIGLCHVSERVPCDLLIVMDCDGEDRPQDISHLVEAAEQNSFRRIIFASRARRSEGLVFRLGYRTYRCLHRLLTGMPVRFGNFSAVPAELLHGLPLVSETWNHYAAAVLKAHLPFAAVPLDRGTRFAGKSSMNLISLTMHGVSAMSVFAEVISVRLLLIAGALGITLVAAGLSAAWQSPEAAHWLMPLVAGMVALSLITSLILGVFMLGIHAFRGTASFLPKRDYHYFIFSEVKLGLGTERSVASIMEDSAT